MEFLGKKKTYQKMEEENLRKIVRLLCRENQADLGTFVPSLKPIIFSFLFFFFFFFLTSADEQFIM